MDTITHALSGALAARATEPKNPRPDQLPRRVRLWVGFWAAAFPDSDFATLLIDPLLYLTTHRGITHSIVMLPLWALVLAIAFAWIWRRKYSWRAFVGVCALGIAAHITGDVITAFGTMVLAPLSDWRAQWPVTFIIDPWFSTIIVGGLTASFLWPRTRVPALAGLAVLATYISVQAVLHSRAVAIGENYAAAQGLREARVEALPQPFSPFHWMIVVSDRESYRLSYVSLVRNEPAPEPPADAFWLARVYYSYQPPAQAAWTRVPRFGDGGMARVVEAVWNSDALARYRHFTLFPAFYRMENHGNQLCVWFNDLRFALVGRTMPFRYGACQDDLGAAWQVYRLITDDNGQELADRIR